MMGRAETILVETDKKTRMLQQDLWGRLPDEVIELVLAKLPFSRLLPFCYVCRRWEKYILSTRAHSLFLWNMGELLVRNLSNGGTGVWERVSLQFHGGLRAEQFQSFYLVGSSGGLVCFHDDSGDDFREFIVCNPLTRRVNRVPLPPLTIDAAAKPDSPKLFVSPRRHVVGIMTSTSSTTAENNNTGHFKLVVLALNPLGPSRGVVGFVYCSRDDSWTRSAKLPRALQRCFTRWQDILGDPCSVGSGPVEHLGCMYWAFSTSHGSGSGKCRCLLIKYNVELNHWSWLNSEILACHSEHCSVHAVLPYNGNLFFLHGHFDRCEQFKIITVSESDSDSIHTLVLETPPMAMSGPRSFCENVVLKTVSRIDDSAIFDAGGGVDVVFPAGGRLRMRMKYYGDGGPVMYYLGEAFTFQTKYSNDKVMEKRLCCEEGENWKRLIVGMEDDVSGLVTSGWEKKPKGTMKRNKRHGDPERYCGGVLSPTL